MSSQMMTTGEARERLGEIRQSDVSFEEKAHEALELGERYLGADSGYLVRTEAEADHWEAIVSTASQEGQFPPERELDLETTYSRRTIAEDEPVTLHDAPAQGWEDDPALETYGIECYHGTPLYIDGEPHGSLCFVAENPRDEPFRTEETLFAGLMARMLEQEIERRVHQTELTRRKNLVNVLNRVLRHNIRNDMGVIRGETRIMADQLGESHDALTTLEKIDGLIELCDKARKVEEVVDQDHDRTQTNLGALVEDVVTAVTAEFPAASVTVDIDADITAPVLPSFERAVRELVENAVKHGGESSPVTVTAEQCSETVELRISDTGPGLSDQEREVLNSGVETPLVHGSGLGLWLVHWIVTSHDGSVEATVTDTGTVMSASIPRVPTAEDTQDLADLSQATDQYKAAFEESFDAQLLLDDQARIIEANPEAATIYGLEQAELRGRSLTEFFPEEFDFDNIWATFGGGGKSCDVVTVPCADGQDKQVEYSATTDVVPGQHLLIARDVTEREQRRRSLERYETALNCINDMVWVYDERKQVTFVNKTSLDAVSLSPDRLIDTPLSALEEFFADPEAFETWETLVEDVLAGTVAEGEQDVTFDVQGDPLVLNLCVTPVPDSDDPTAAAVVASDITERKQHERVLEGYDTMRENTPAGSEPTETEVLRVTGGAGGTTPVADTLERENDQLAVEVAHTPGEGLERVDACPPDCVVSDYELSGMDGIDLLSAVREEYPELPFILYTDSGSESVAGEAIAAGVTDYVRRDTTSKQSELLANRVDNAVARSRAEQQVSTTQRRLRELSEATHDINWMVTADWSECLFVNSAYEEMWGRSRSDLLENPMDFLQGVHPADRDRVTAEMKRASEGEPVDFEFRITSDGDPQQWVWVQAEPIYDETPEPTRIAGFVRDVTERKERERMLTKTESIVENMSDGAVIVQDGVIRHVNPRVFELVGYDEDELLGTPVAAFVAPDYRETVERRHQARVAGDDADLPDQYELEMLSDSGQHIPVEVNTSRIEYQGQPATLSLVRDITDRRERQQALDIEHSRADALFEQLGEPVVEVAFEDGTPVIDSTNGTFERTFCTGDDRLVGETLDETLVPEIDQVAARSLTNRVEAGAVVEEELEVPTAAGERTFLLRTVPYSLDGPPRAYGIYFDITERKRREEQFQAFIEQSTDIVSVLDPDGTYQYQSPSAGRILGRDAGDVIGDDPFEFVHPDHRERVLATFSEAMSNPETNPTAEYKFRHGDDSWIWLESIGNNQLDNPAIEGLVVNSRDISERKERERRLERERDRLDEFAGIVSHDLRNPLNVAQSRLELAQDACESEHLDHVERAHDRMEQLVGDVLSLARAGETIGETDVVDLATLVETCWQTVETGGADLVGGTDVSIRADRNQFKQLVENLLRNAVEHGGDDVTITTGDIPGGIYVEDDGTGIPESDRATVLEPGYSTSETGTGFGLSIVRDVAEAHGWTVEVTEGTEGGARFELSGIEIC